MFRWILSEPRRGAWRGTFWLTALLSCAAVPCAVRAKGCDSGGQLRYLGVSNNAGKSVWLSATSPGQFALESAKGNQTVDAWSRQRRGLRISTSPDVSNGNGGTHKLYATDNGNPCLLDTQNQSGGFVFPPGFPSFPPTGVLPPVTGLMPGMPGAVTPPIATLPPPTGLTPTVPGAVTPPIGTLPPPSGLTPSVPGAVTPPIATLPPTSGLTPTVPGAVTPPIATLPPPTGLAPTVPGAVTPTTVPAQRLASTDVRCSASMPPSTTSASSAADRPECGESQLPASTAPPSGKVVPLSEGRELVEESLWNGWVDLHRVGSTDRRNGLDLDNATGGATLGIDRRFGANFVAGLSLSLDRSSSDAFGGDLRTQTKGYLIGPYAAYRVSDHWAVDAAVALGRYETDTRLDVLTGTGTAGRYTLEFNANGQYEAGQALVRPRLSAYYAHMRNDSHVLQGVVAGEEIGVAIPGTSSSYGAVEGSGEVTQSFHVSGSASVVAPYARLAVRYEFARPNDGAAMAGDLSMMQTGPWGGSLRVGARTLADRATMIEAEAGYLSLGQPGLHAWELRLYISHAF